MIVLDDFIDELLRDVSHGIQVQRDHPSHLILVNLDEVHTCV